METTEILKNYLAKERNDFLSQLNDCKTVEELKKDWRIKQFITTTTDRKKLSFEQLSEAIINIYDKRQAKKFDAELLRIETEKNQPEVESMTISIEWKKSRTWGSNPHAEVQINFKDKTAGEWKTGYFRKDGYTCSGCGYDKESTVIAEIFNEFMKGEVWKLTPEQRKGGNGSGDNGNAPYGIHVYNDLRPHFGGGIGTSCYYRIAEYLGGKFEHIASGKTFDVYRYSKN